jgi:hypothetical protein
MLFRSFTSFVAKNTKLIGFTSNGLASLKGTKKIGEIQKLEFESSSTEVFGSLKYIMLADFDET